MEINSFRISYDNPKLSAHGSTTNARVENWHNTTLQILNIGAGFSCPTSKRSPTSRSGSPCELWTFRYAFGTDHESRYRISVSAEGLLPLETPNDLPTEGDDDPVAARVDDCIPSGCAKSG